MADQNVELNPGGQTPGVDSGSAPVTPQTPNANPGDTGGGGSGEKTYSFKEDRSDWVPRTRINEVQQRAQQAFDKRLQEELDKRFNDQQTRLKTAFGIDTPDPEQAEAEQLRKVLYKIAPHLAELEGLTKDEIAELRESARSARDGQDAQWKRHAASMMGRGEKEIASSLGLKALSERQKSQFHNAYYQEATACYRDRVRAQKTGDESYDFDGDFIARHERGDETLVQEFAKAFVDEWAGPVRRSVQASAERRNRPVPRGERSRTQVTTNTMPNLDLSKEEDFKKAMAAARGQS